MERKLCALLAAAASATAAAGCEGLFSSSEPMVAPDVYPPLAAAELETLGQPEPEDLAFGEALATYSQEVADLHAYQGSSADGRIDRAMARLAVAIERIPGVTEGDRSTQRTATAMRVIQTRRLGIAGVKRALDLTATELLRLAAGPYADAPEVAARARTFAGAVGAIDLDLEPPDRVGVIEALVRAERALAAMYVADVSPYRP